MGDLRFEGISTFSNWVTNSPEALPMSRTHVSFGSLPGISSNKHASAPFESGTYTVFLSSDCIVVGTLNDNGPIQ